MDRITPRYVFEARIRIRVEHSDDMAMEGWTRDISETGLSAFVARGLNSGDVVTLDIPLAPSRRITVPAKVARCLGTQYGFQFTALSPDQRSEIRSAVRNRPEIAPFNPSGGESPRPPVRSDTHSPAPEAPPKPNVVDAAFVERARTLIKRGYTPKVAVELVLHEVEVEHGKNSQTLQKARVDAEDFLQKARRGLI